MSTAAVAKFLTTGIMAMLILFGRQHALAAESWKIEDLMAELAAIQSVAVTFEEQRTSAFLTETLIVSGRMVYRAPGHMEKHILEPFVERVLVEGDEMSVEKYSRRGKKKEKVYAVESHQILETAVKVVRAVLGGDVDYLKSIFDIELTGPRDSWKMTLLPVEKKTRRRLDKVVLQGDGPRILQVMTFEADGDETLANLSYELIR